MKLILTGGGVGERAKTAFSLLAKEIKGGEVLYLPFAEEEMTTNEVLEWFKSQIAPYGIKNVSIVHSPTELTSERIDKASGIFIGGGNAFKLLKTIKENNLLPLISKALKEKVVLGLSAGATIFGKDINSCLRDELNIIANDRNTVGLKDTKGIEIIKDFSIFVHYKLSSKQIVQTKQKVDKILSFSSGVIAIPEESCIYINNTEITAFGEEPIEVITKDFEKFYQGGEKINLKINMQALTKANPKCDYVFSLAKISDLSSITKLYKDVIANTFTTWDENYPSIELIKKDILQQNLYVLRQQNNIIATSFLGQKENDDNWDTRLLNPLSVARICVSPQHQGRGIGKMFLKQLMETAKNLGADGMHFHVCTLNQAAMRMYESCGFKNTGLGKSNYDYDYYKYEIKF